MSQAIHQGGGKSASPKRSVQREKGRLVVISTVAPFVPVGNNLKEKFCAGPPEADVRQLINNQKVHLDELRL